MKKLFLLFFLLSTSSFLSQEIKFVNAPNGLIVRNSPDKNSERIGKLENGVRVSILKETEVSLTIKDAGKLINGNWIEIKDFNSDLKGYVFGGFLSIEVPNKGAETKDYYLTKIDSITLSNYWENSSKNIETKPTFIYLRNKKHFDILKFAISDFESYDGTSFNIRENTKLKGILKIIKVESSYSACCSNTDEYFYLMTKEYHLITLQKIENDHCDGSEPYFTYLFPSDKNGIKDKIIYAKIIPQDKADNKIEVIKTLSWYDKKGLLLEE